MFALKAFWAARPGQPWHATNTQVHCESTPQYSAVGRPAPWPPYCRTITKPRPTDGGLEDKFILKTGSSLFPKICRSYFLFTPHGLGDFLDQFELVPLFQLGQLVADLTGGKAALRTQAKTVERDMLFCLMDAGDYSIFVLQTGRFGRYKTQHHLFAICNILQRLKAAGARIVKFQIKRIHIFLCQQEGGNGEVIALARPSGMVVAAADMGCDGQAFRAVFQCQIIQAQILGSDILDLVWVSFRKFW